MKVYFNLFDLKKIWQSSEKKINLQAKQDGRVTEWPKVLDWKSSVLLKGTVGSNPTSSAYRIRADNVTSGCEPRQDRKVATVADS